MPSEYTVVLCPIYNEPLDYFCVQCNVYCCAYCILVGEHTGHQVVPRNQAPTVFTESVRQKVDAISTKTESVTNEALQIDAKCQGRMQELSLEAAQVQEQIDALLARRDRIEVDLKKAREASVIEANHLLNLMREVLEEATRTTDHANAHRDLCSQQVMADLQMNVVRVREAMRRLRDFSTGKVHLAVPVPHPNLFSPPPRGGGAALRDPSPQQQQQQQPFYEEVLRSVGSRRREVWQQVQPTRSPRRSPLLATSPPQPSSQVAPSPTAFSLPSLKQYHRLRKCLRDASFTGGSGAKSIVAAIAHLRQEAEKFGVEEVLQVIAADRELLQLFAKLEVS